MSLLQKIKSVGIPRVNSEIYEISPRGEPMFVSHRKRDSFHIDIAQDVSTENNEDVDHRLSIDKPLPATPAPTIPARNPKRRERVHDHTSSDRVAPSSKPLACNTLNGSSFILSSNDKSGEHLDPVREASSVDATTLRKSYRFSGQRHSLLSLDELFGDESVGDFDRLLNAIEKVQTSFTEGQQGYEVVAPLSQGELNAASELDKSHELDQRPWNEEKSANTEDLMVAGPVEADDELVPSDLIVDEVTKRTDQRQGLNDVATDLTDDRYTVNADPATAANPDEISGHVSEEVTVRLMLDTNVLQDREVIAALSSSHSEPTSDLQPVSAGTESGRSYSIDEHHGSPNIWSDEGDCRHNKTGTDTPRTHYSELIGDAPHARDHSDPLKDKCHKDTSDKSGNSDHIPQPEEPRRSNLNISDMKPLEFLSPTIYQPALSTSASPAADDEEDNMNSTEAQRPHTRILSWLSTHPEPTDSTTRPRPAPTSLASFGHLSAALEKPSPSSSPRQSVEQQERFALDAQLEIEHWLTEWTSTSHVRATPSSHHTLAA
nr:hypothetical protein CFP56_43855 [Quercus suber]